MADMPYSVVSVSMMWHIFFVLYTNVTATTPDQVCDVEVTKRKLKGQIHICMLTLLVLIPISIVIILYGNLPLYMPYMYKFLRHVNFEDVINPVILQFYFQGSLSIMLSD